MEGGIHRCRYLLSGWLRQPAATTIPSCPCPTRKLTWSAKDMIYSRISHKSYNITTLFPWASQISIPGVTPLLWEVSWFWCHDQAGSLSRCDKPILVCHVDSDYCCGFTHRNYLGGRNALTSTYRLQKVYLEFSCDPGSFRHHLDTTPLPRHGHRMPIGILRACCQS